MADPETTTTSDEPQDLGSRELARATTAWLVCILFALTFLIATVTGASTATSVLRGSIVAGAAWFLVPVLIRPVVGAIITAMARDVASRDSGKSEGAEA